MQVINRKIKQIFGFDKNFAEYLKIDFRDFSSKKKTCKNKIDWLNSFLKPLKLRIEIVPLLENET